MTGLIMRMRSAKKLVIKLFATLNQNEKEKSWFDDWFDITFEIIFSINFWGKFM